MGYEQQQQNFANQLGQEGHDCWVREYSFEELQDCSPKVYEAMRDAILHDPSNEHHQMLTKFHESEDPEFTFPPTLHKAQAAIVAEQHLRAQEEGGAAVAEGEGGGDVEEGLVPPAARP